MLFPFPFPSPCPANPTHHRLASLLPTIITPYAISKRYPISPSFVIATVVVARGGVLELLHSTDSKLS